MSPPIGATTRAMPGKGRFAVTVVAPSGEVAKSVRCGSADQVIHVVKQEGERSPRWTMFLVTREANGEVEPVARWAVGPKGLVRAPYRANESASKSDEWFELTNEMGYLELDMEQLTPFMEHRERWPHDGYYDDEAKHYYKLVDQYRALKKRRDALGEGYKPNENQREQLADQIRAMDRERTKLSVILEKKGMDAEDEQGRPVHERLLSLQDERNDLAEKYRAASRKFSSNAKPRKTKYRGWVIDVSQDARGYWTGTYGQPKKKPVGWRAEFRRPQPLGRGMTNVEILERGKSIIDKLESQDGASYAANPKLPAAVTEVLDALRPLGPELDEDELGAGGVYFMDIMTKDSFDEAVSLVRAAGYKGKALRKGGLILRKGGVETQLTERPFGTVVVVDTKP